MPNRRRLSAVEAARAPRLRDGPQELVAGLEAEGIPTVAHFIDAGHVAGSDGMSKALKGCVDDFVAQSAASQL